MFASCYGPPTCSPCTGQDFYARAFTSGVTPENVEYDYVG